MTRAHRAASWIIALFPSVAGCGAPALSARSAAAPTVADTGVVATCAATKDPLHPLIVEWPAASRAELEAAAQRGAVVVSYAGCTLKVLTGCHAPGADAYDS